MPPVYSQPFAPQYTAAAPAPQYIVPNPAGSLLFIDVQHWPCVGTRSVALTLMSLHHSVCRWCHRPCADIDG
ncbi:hypothetical protein GDO81_018950 [Engystomops pustulosus]|uniref:Uncharacterized protein n=1 Tax=Engystomops pustulosus TaxID=76066 RepID=A0AAV6YGA7_ENGPU|nr:hypothetical protein GDO81_018950 [Engystomops pustulosus]